MRIIFENFLNEGKEFKKILAYGTNNRFPYSLSNFAFALNQNKAKVLASSKYPEIYDYKNWKAGGWEFSNFVVKLIINKSRKSGNSICKNLNVSGIGYSDWIVKEEDKGHYCIISSKKSNADIRIDF